MSLPKSTHTFEFLTTAWLGGANPSDVAEVRGTTLRGIRRAAFA